MSRRSVTEQREYLECDGCEYVFGRDDSTVVLTVNEQELHFHDAEEHGWPCFMSWLDKMQLAHARPDLHQPDDHQRDAWEALTGKRDRAQKYLSA